MTKKPARLRTTRMFSLQLADYDSHFAPREKRRRAFAFLRRFVSLLPYLIVIMFPSFRLGQAVFQDPGMPFPASLEQGDIFTLPVIRTAQPNGEAAIKSAPSESQEEREKTRTSKTKLNDSPIMVPVIAGRPLGMIEGKEPLFLGAAIKPFDFDITVDFYPEGGKKNFLRSFVPLSDHPKYSIFVKRIHVTLQPDPMVPPNQKISPSRETDPSLAALAAPAITASEAQVYDRFDGNIRLKCWQKPEIDPLGVDPLKPRRLARLGSLTTAGSGEVVFSGPSSNGNGESVVVIYHGGGLFTRYWGIKELKIPRNKRVTAGQVIGLVHLAHAKKVPPASWNALMGGVGGPGVVKTQSLMELSTRLCDSK